MSLTICIKIDDAGQITVGTMPGMQGGGAPAEGQPDMEGGMARMEAPAAPEESGMQPVKSIDEALQVARDLLANRSQVEDAEAEEAAFQKSFGGQSQQLQGGGM